MGLPKWRHSGATCLLRAGTRAKELGQPVGRPVTDQLTDSLRKHFVVILEKPLTKPLLMTRLRVSPSGRHDLGLYMPLSDPLRASGPVGA